MVFRSAAHIPSPDVVEGEKTVRPVHRAEARLVRRRVDRGQQQRHQPSVLGISFSYICIYIYMNICIVIYININIYIYICVYKYTNKYVYININMYIRISVSILLYHSVSRG